MRLHLDSSAAGASDSAQAVTASGTGSRPAARGGGTAPAGDIITVSSSSSALNASSAQRGARIEQLTALVRSGQYQVSSATLSGAIVGHAGSSPAGSF